ncbi:aldolase [Salinadaptatus halalkaliphilus]|uniref:Aldolase n=2 Tax=Salinadaptatus halalkaliphilus TaxID=2419781 RepID=A0A4S3TMY2_9EURY|nr:aldolase [Salinadaptatus halalkaliphilus]
MQRIASGQPVFGADARTFSPSVVEVYASLGFDYVWLDFEHAGPNPVDSHLLEQLTRAAESSGIELMVRVPSTDAHMIRKVLDTGVKTLVLPRIRSAEAVRSAISATQFSYDGEPGRRGAGIARANGWGTGSRPADDRDDDIFVGAMIENDDAVDDIDDILSVPELGFVFMGPADLSVSLGKPFDKTAPAVQDRIERVVNRANEAGVPAGQTFPTAESADDALEAGYDVLTLGSELSAVVETYEDRLESLRE